MKKIFELRIQYMVMYRSDVKHIIVKGYSSDEQCWKAFNIFKVWVQRSNEVKIQVPPQTRRICKSIKLGWSSCETSGLSFSSG